MDDSDATLPEQFAAHLRRGDSEAAAAVLDRLDDHDTDTQKTALQAGRAVLADDEGSLDGLATAVAAFLDADDRGLRLAAAKTLAVGADTDPAGCLPAADAVADTLADDGAFYYVRARCAETLGYLALADPETVGTPDRLADLRVGLAFDEPEVREKLAKALAYVALGDPDRLRHQVDSLAEHLDDERELVRYHLCTALVVVGCAHPAKLSPARDALWDRLDDESPYVRGRAAEALGLLARAVDEAADGIDTVEPGDGEAAGFVADRVAFACGESTDGVGTVGSVRETVDEAAAAITAPDDDECPHCGLELPASAPPMCPRCGGPY